MRGATTRASKPTIGILGLRRAIPPEPIISHSAPPSWRWINGYVARAGTAPTSADDVDRQGIRIAVAQGSAPHTVLRRLIKQAEIVPVPGGFEAAREALAKGNA